MSTGLEAFDTAFEEALAATGGTGASYPRIDCEGTWVVKVIEASYGATQKGDAKRGMVKVEVVSNQGESADKVGGRTNLYLTVGKDDKLTVRNLAPWRQTFINLIGKEKLMDDVADFDDLIQSIVNWSNKLLKRGTDVYVVLTTRKQGKLDERGREQFYKNISVYTPEVKSVETAPVASKVDDPFAE